MKSQAEFDAYASEYSAGMEHPLKKFAGRSAEEFIELKAELLIADLKHRPLSPQSAATLKCLDFGCGTGIFLKVLSERGFRGEFFGCDASEEMLVNATETCAVSNPPQFKHVPADNELPYDSASFDIVIAAAVLHHVPVSSRRKVYQEISRVLRPGGRFYVFEHNPFNPITNWVVRHTPIDDNAILLRAKEVREGLHEAGLIRIAISYLMFFPPRWRWARPFERTLRVVPLGGQYLVTGDHC